MNSFTFLFYFDKEEGIGILCFYGVGSQLEERCLPLKNTIHFCSTRKNKKGKDLPRFDMYLF